MGNGMSITRKCALPSGGTWLGSAFPRSSSTPGPHSICSSRCRRTIPCGKPRPWCICSLKGLAARAEFYGGASLSEPELEGATRVFADAILTSRQTGEVSGLDQVLSILRAVGQTWDNRAATAAANIARRLLHHLEPMLAKRSELGSRAILLEAVRKSFDWLSTAARDKNPLLDYLAAAHDKIGDVHVAQGHLGTAVDSYKASYAILEPLVEADPSNAQWQHHLSIVHNRIGEAYRPQGDLSAALDSHNAALAILERLTEADSHNTELRHDLARTQGKIARY